ncbi:acetate--CoA ligase family protein [Bacteroidota bacterium]
MINQQLLNPRSIVVVGGSNNIHKPGGKVLKNLIDGKFKGDLYVTNLKEDEVQGIKSFKDPADLPEVDMAIIAIAAKFCPQTVKILANEKNTRAFIILSAGFSEENEEGAKLEKDIVDTINAVNGCLIGPNIIGIINQNVTGTFTTPVPKLDPHGVDFISGSGATAVFIMESGIPKGLSFSSVYSVGNSAQVGVEDILKHMDESFDPEKSSRVKLLYLESIEKPEMLLKHASSLIRKGCKIAAIKAGSSEAGSRAASSHTGALASPDTAVEVLFRKAGIVRCYSRDELSAVASVFLHKDLKGKNIAIITHAGGPAVMLTDSLSNGGMTVPPIEGFAADELLEKLNPGSSVANPIDFLATGSAEQLGHIIDYCENSFENIDGMVVIFGSPGLCDVTDVYKILDEKMKSCDKPIFPVLPSVINAKKEIDYFLSLGRINFPDEVILGEALSKVFYAPEASSEEIELPVIDNELIRKTISEVSDGYIQPEKVQTLLDAAGISRAEEFVVDMLQDALIQAEAIGYPVVMKVVGPIHKSDAGGVALNIMDPESVDNEFRRMMDIPDAEAVMIQPMLSGEQLFAGVKYEENYGHIIMCGLGGIYIEVLKDVSKALAPVDKKSAVKMIRELKSYSIIKGVRGQEGVNEDVFADIIVRLGALVQVAPEIYEIDLNPLLGKPDSIIAVDARINIKIY